jgi:integrase
MPVYPKKTRGRDKWTVTIWHRGKRQDWTITGSKADAEAFEARKRVGFEVHAPGEIRTAPSFYDFCVSRYRPHAESHLKASTWHVRTYQLATLQEFFGPMRLTRITTEDVERYKNWRTERGAKPVTINNELAVLQAVRSFARHIGVPVGDFNVMHLPVRGRGRVTFWTTKQVAALYAKCDKLSPDILPLVVFIANTGCRKGEALALTWPHVDLKRRMIHFWPSDEWQPKDNEPREVPMSDSLAALLKRRRKVGMFVFPANHGDRYAEWPRRAFDRARRAAKLRGGPHTLRHTYATHFLQRVPDLYLLSKVLGHSHERTTKLYAHLLPDHLAKARNAVDFSLDLLRNRIPNRVRAANGRDEEE